MHELLLDCKASILRIITVTIFRFRLKLGSMQSCGAIVKKIKGTAHKNGDIDGTCKRTRALVVFTRDYFAPE